MFTNADSNGVLANANTYGYSNTYGYTHAN